MASASSPRMADASANTNAEMARTSLHPSARTNPNPDDDFMRQFGAVLAQLKVGNIASLALSVRRNMQARDSTEQKNPSGFTDNIAIGCKVFPEPLRGSYNIAYRVLFDDSIEWILKVPANGSYARFDRMAADALTSEALTMKMIKLSTTIPVPTVHGFDISLDNEVGCPYILMDFLKGRPLYEGWFDPDASSAKREQFRARALRTIAAAMVQLNQFTLHRGGALRFDSAGQPVDVAGAKVPDTKAFYDCVDEEFCPEHDLWCENGPTTDPSSYLLFTLNRRGSKEGDSAYSRGVHESTRLFTKWALELSDNMDLKGQQFVLAHPDFDLQNMLVCYDGTLSGILDWDGVAAVPLSVGCLRYPNWLIRDWDPVNYNWNVEAHEPKSYSGRLENTPDELVCYRAMYAQFIEMLLPTDPMNSNTGKIAGDLTRMSLITGSLEVAVNRPRDTGRMIGHLFREVKRVAGEDHIDLADTGSLESDVGSDISDIDNSDTDSLASGDGVNGGNNDEDTAPTEIEQSISRLSDGGRSSYSEYHCQKSNATLHESSPEDVDEENDETNLPALDAASREAPGFEKGGPEMPLFDNVPAKETACDQKSAASQTVEVAKWALDLGEKGCKRALKAFHKKEHASGVQPGDRAEMTPTQDSSQPDSNTVKAAIRLCNWTETLLRKVTAQVHQSVPSAQVSTTPNESETRQVQIFLKWLIAILKKIIQKPVKSDAEDAETLTTAEGRLPQNSVLVDTEHCQRCNLGEEKPGVETSNNGEESAKIDSEDVWALIAAKVNKSGIPIDLIKKRHDVIAQCVIENLGQEIEREKEKELYLKKKEAARKAKKTRKQTEMTNANHGSNLDSTQHPAFVESKLAKPNLVEARVAETEAAQIGMSEGCAANVEDGKADTTSEPENAACSNYTIVAPEDPNSDAVDPTILDHTTTNVDLQNLSH